MRVAAAPDEIRDGDPLGRDRALREQSEGAGDLLGRPRVERLAVQEHVARARGQQARERTQQRRLAASVRSDDRRDPAGRDGEVESVDDRAVAVGEGECVRRQRVPRGGIAVVGHSEPPERFVLMRR